MSLSVLLLSASLAGRIAVPGYAPTVLVVTFFGSITSLGLGILGQYVWLILQTTRGRPGYLVDRVESFRSERASRPRDALDRMTTRSRPAANVAWAVALVALFLLTALFRFLHLEDGFPNDHFLYLAGAQQILLGEWPTQRLPGPGPSADVRRLGARAGGPGTERCSPRRCSSRWRSRSRRC